jgi:ribosomal protein S7
MILQARLDNTEPSLELEESDSGGCTYRCTRAEVSTELATLVATWHTMTQAQRNAVSLMAAALVGR